MQAVFVLDDAGEATGQVYPFCEACARLLREKEESRVAALVGDSRYAWGLSDESQHDEDQCCDCGEPLHRDNPRNFHESPCDHLRD